MILCSNELHLQTNIKRFLAVIKQPLSVNTMLVVILYIFGGDAILINK